MIAETTLGVIVGSGFRLAPELLRFIERMQERDHELEMNKVALDFEKIRGAQRQAEVQAPGFFDNLKAQAEGLVGQIREQFTTGPADLAKWSIMVRPATTYALVALYVLIKAVLVYFGLKALATPAEMGRILYGAEDHALLSGVLAFWYMDRTISKARGSQ